MSWYIIVLLVFLYIVIWILTSVILSRKWKRKNSIDEATLYGMMWPIIIIGSPLILLDFVIMKIVEKFGYKEDEK